jgi:ATP-dependent Clp protease protease subunit
MKSRARGLLSASLIIALGAGTAMAQEAGAPAGASGKKVDTAAQKKADAKKAAAKKDAELEKLKAEKKKLAAEKKKLMDEIKSIKDTHKKAITRMQAEVGRLSAEAGLRSARLKASLSAQTDEMQRIQSNSSLERARDGVSQAKFRKTLAEYKNRSTMRKLKEMAELADARSESAKISTKLALERARRQAKLAAFGAERERLQAEGSLLSARMALAATKRKVALAEASAATDALALMATRAKMKDVVTDAISHPAKPFSHGRLVISDRRISLNQPIITGTADYVCKRIHFYNNQSSTKPIFLVIDRCPGGSVMEGYRIVKAMKASKAPIHVVVKSFAASMAAVITTLADHSYAYPNAVILHHQMSSGAGGNMTQIKEQYDEMKQWERRLMDPVCKKLGITRAQFIKDMYKHNSGGDWAEFGDRAVKLRWVNDVVKEIREAGITQLPKGKAPSPWYFFSFGKVEKDAHGNSYRTLPRLGAYDFYMIHNPRNFWRQR